MKSQLLPIINYWNLLIIRNFYIKKIIHIKTWTAVEQKSFLSCYITFRTSVHTHCTHCSSNHLEALLCLPQSNRERERESQRHTHRHTHTQNTYTSPTHTHTQVPLEKGFPTYLSIFVLWHASFDRARCHVLSHCVMQCHTARHVCVCVCARVCHTYTHRIRPGVFHFLLARIRHTKILWLTARPKFDLTKGFSARLKSTAVDANIWAQCLPF